MVNIYDIARYINEGKVVKPYKLIIVHPLFRQELDVTLKAHVLEVKGLLGTFMFRRMVHGDPPTVRVNTLNKKILVPTKQGLENIDNIKKSVLVVDASYSKLKDKEYVERLKESSNYFLFLKKRWW